jgi:hypothetical protein
MKPIHGKRLITNADEALLNLLDRSPQLRLRMERILALTKAEDGELRSADALEELLVEEVRRLGGEVMHEWAVRAEERAAGEVQADHPKATVRKKKS